MKGNSGRTFAEACRAVAYRFKVGAVRCGSPLLVVGLVGGVTLGCAQRHPSAINAPGLDAGVASVETIDGQTGDSLAHSPESRRSFEPSGSDPVRFDRWNSEKPIVIGSLPQSGVAYVDGAGFEGVLVRGEGIEYTVTELTSPSRVVLDLTGIALPGNSSVDTPESSSISRVRVGSHPDKVRIVLDVRGSESRSPEVVRIDEGVLLSFATPVSMTTPDSLAGSAKGFEPEAAEVAAIVDEPAPSIAIGSIDSFIEPSFSNSPRLLSFGIEPIDQSQNMLVAELNTPGNFTFKRTAPSEYVLTLEGTSLGDLPSDTLLAPPAAGLIRSVRPVIQGDNTALRIFTVPSATLQARASGSKIVVIRSEAGDMRAQAAPVTADALREGEGGVDFTPVATGGAGNEFAALLEDTPRYTGRLISLDLQDTDIDNALRIIAEVSNLNIIASGDVAGKVTLRLIDVPWDQALDVILKTNGLDKVQEGNVVRIAPVEKLRAEREALKQAQQAEEALEPLGVKYIRVSYARASELKPLVETVISERGSVTYDDRTNQIIIKDIRGGIRNVAELVSKIDLRTPQVLLETQIVEASRSLLRDLGSELGFSSIQSPATGNATGNNFPNSIGLGGSLGGGNTASGFPAAVSASEGSAISLLLGSADGTKSLTARLTALEQEGRVRIISRPAVATTNNKQATIKSVEKIRVKTPDGGLAVATGQGASAGGAATTATEAIEIGIQLEVTPQASPDYYVLLDVRAKSSTFGDREVDGIPSEVERSANSTVLVSSGQTFAMGGIYKIQDRDSLSGVPFLKDVPFLGYLFRRQRVENDDEELLFFITPRIIEGSFDDAAMKMAS